MKRRQLQIVPEWMGPWVAQRNWIIPVLLFCIFFILYSFSRTNGAFFTSDTLSYALRIEVLGKPKSLHLLYTYAGHVFYLLWVALGYEGRALFPLQIFNATVGALGISLFFILILNLIGNKVVAFCASLLLGISYGYWRYAVEANPYPLTLLFLICSFLLMLRIFECYSTSNSILLGITNALAALFTFSGVLLAPVVAVAIYLSAVSFWRRIKSFFAYAMSLIIAVLIPYMFVAIFVERATSPDPRWLYYYILSESGLKGWLGTLKAFSLKGLAKAPLGLGNLLVGEVPILSYSAHNASLRNLLLAIVPGAVPTETVTRSGTAADLYVVLAFALMALVFLGLLVSLMGFIVYWRTIWRHHKKVVILCNVWFLAFAALAIYRTPDNVHYWIPNLIPLWTMFAFVLEAARNNRRRCLRVPDRLVSLFIIFLFVANLLGSILPTQGAARNNLFRISQVIANIAQPGDLIVTLQAGEYRQAHAYLQYYAHVHPFRVALMFFIPEEHRATYVRSMNLQIESKLSNGRHVYVLSDVFNSSLGVTQIARYSGRSEHKVRAQLDALFEHRDLELVLEYEGEPLLYQVLH